MGRWGSTRSCSVGSWEGRSDASIRFDALRSLLLHLGFEERTKGSHHIFRRVDVEQRINLQRDGSRAKPYQVRQVRSILLRYRLGELPDA